MNTITVTLPIPDDASNSMVLAKVQDLAIELAEEMSDEICVGMSAALIREACQVTEVSE